MYSRSTTTSPLQAAMSMTAWESRRTQGKTFRPTLEEVYDPEVSRQQFRHFQDAQPGKEYLHQQRGLEPRSGQHHWQEQTSSTEYKVWKYGRRTRSCAHHLHHQWSEVHAAHGASPLFIVCVYVHIILGGSIR
ncbi:hypothetical protein TraAM80_06256 [Trypanosoma rangeli]|uniref:Uncharacterized protein n=1 Tax=Trypanosoma rangeli TaxID=5698 RepID=A0A3R7MB73_TRYRA|nr:uncharacterized protein TraAM80_06256 [Trypanosoma rangeli]RNF02742.1 hypothetical protein TraAM80_06256 [Trypanosoma rangeli]|eukprot:RNF02742.1 hypothetical protein TraAM80_06256 [Trypanosoma rangeli]